MLSGNVVIHHEQHVGIALGTTGEIGQCGRIIVPDGPWRYSRQQLRHIIGRIHQVLFQRIAQLHLLFFQARRQSGRQAFASAGRQPFKTALDLTPGLLQLARKLLTVRPKARIQIRLKGRHCAARQCNSHQHLHQESDT